MGDEAVSNGMVTARRWHNGSWASVPAVKNTFLNWKQYLKVEGKNNRWVCLAWRCGGFLLKVQYLLSTNHTFKSYKNMFFTQKSTSHLPFKHPLIRLQSGTVTVYCIQWIYILLLFKILFILKYIKIIFFLFFKN